MEWKKGKPTKEGYYLFKKRGQWPVYTGSVLYGRWQEMQDPIQLYCKGVNLENNREWDIEYHFGPIPPYPRAKEANALYFVFGIKENKE
jgi:hypothetical protein